MATFPTSTILPEISRPILEAEIERLIDMLDQIDEDPDLESTGDEEPWLGAPAGIQSNGFSTNWHGLNSQGNDDREEDCEDEGAQCDDEGAIECDLEPDHDNERWSDGLPCYAGPCSLIETLIGGCSHA